MLFKKYLNEKDRIKANNGLLKFFVIVIGGITLYNSILLQESLHSQKIILIPSTLNSKMTITDKGDNSLYIKAVVRDIVNLAFNYIPATARSQFSDLLAMYNADSFASAKSKWYDFADTVESAKQISSVFYIQKMEVLPDSNIVEVTGLKKQFVDSKMVEDSVKTYIIEYEMKDGRFFLKGKGIYEKEK